MTKNLVPVPMLAGNNSGVAIGLIGLMAVLFVIAHNKSNVAMPMSTNH